MKCRHCYIELRNVSGVIYCTQCQSHYTSFASLQKLMAEIKYFNFLSESKKKSMLSRYNCDFCNQRMSLHLNSEIQFESCYMCQQAWFEKGELQKINSKSIPTFTGESNYSLTEQMSKAPLEKFSEFQVDVSSSDLDTQFRWQKWVILTFIYEGILNIIFYPIRYLMKNHPFLLFILIVVCFYTAKKYINAIEL